MNLDFENARKYASTCALALSDRLLEGHGTADVIALKSSDACDVVTEFDREVEQRLYESLSKFDAGIGFHGEEFGATGSSETYWLVDPIDGTGHYHRGNPFSTSMIALIDNGCVVASVINHFVSGHLFSASLGGGATCNDDTISVSENNLQQGYVGVEINPSVEGNLELIRQVTEATDPLSTINCGWEFSMVASGRLDGRVMKDPWGSVWDFAPGSLLVSEAGGAVANLYETTYDFRNFDFLAVTPRIFEDLTTGPNAIFPIR